MNSTWFFATLVAVFVQNFARILPEVDEENRELRKSVPQISRQLRNPVKYGIPLKNP